MNRKIYYSIFIVVVLLLLTCLTFKTMAKTEEQNHKIVFTDTNFEIRFYPATTLATVYSNAKTYKELSGNGFRMLAGYIFGGNATETKISMTSPVHMQVNESAATMSFVMPSNYNEDNLPTPDNAEVKIEKTEDEYVAVIRFGGYASDDDVKKYGAKLEALLMENGIEYYGKFRLLGYNPPYEFFGRRNEIIVSVKWPVDR